MVVNFTADFKSVDESEVASNILRKRYFQPGESSWKDVATRVVDFVLGKDSPDYKDTLDMLLGTYFIPNSPCLVNAGKQNKGLSACFVVPMEDSLEDIFFTKYAFAKIAQKGGGCGTTLSNLRPENSPVSGSAHGYAGGPVKFFNTVCEDMKAMTQAGLTI